MNTHPYRKKLIEVALPLEAINKAAAREKSIRHGHPSTLHLWWARRPLAACRAVLFASLVDDPDSDPAYRKADGTLDEERAGVKRAELFNLIEELVQWANSNDPLIIGAARAEIARCVASRKLETGELKKDHKLPGGETVWDLVVKGHGDLQRLRAGVTKLPNAESVNLFLATYAPPVLDPFAGGGSIPLEAQRLGLRAYASDLNPVPVLINKALIEIPPKFAGKPPVNPKTDKKMEWHGAEGLAEDVRYYGQWMRDEAETLIGHLYPKVKITKEMAQDRPDLKPHIGAELTVIAWLWARTVASPDPSCRGAKVPIIKSFCLSQKKGNEVWVEPIIDRSRNDYGFRIRQGTWRPATTQTVNRKGARCLISGTHIPFEYIRAEGKAGRLGTTLVAMVADSSSGRIYLSPECASLVAESSSLQVPYIDLMLPYNPFAVRPPLYGYNRVCDLFTSRQLAALSGLCELSKTAGQRVAGDGASAEYACAVRTYLAFAISKCADYWNTIATWMPRGTVGHAFSKQAIPMTWDYPEPNPFAEFHCAWQEAVEWVAKVIENLPGNTIAGDVSQFDASVLQKTALPKLVSTDPPYYNNIDYADLSDFFYVWLRKSVGDVYPGLFATMSTPKKQELVASQYRFDGDRERARSFFETGLESAFRNMEQIQQPDYPLSVFYAFKQAETEDDDGDASELSGESSLVSTGWETMLEGLRRSGFCVNGTWPMRTERSSRSMSIGMNALASSVVLVCRPRPASATLATRKELITVLRRELPAALRMLQRGSIAPVDLAQAAIGPGMAVFTRYAKVMETDGSSMSVRMALGLINQALDEVLAEQEGEFDGDTRWALAWFEQFGLEEGAFGIAETLSKAKNTAINGLVEAGIVAARAGKVRLLRREELGGKESGDRRQKTGGGSQETGWDPATDKRFTIWEATQHLIHRLQNDGEEAAAALLRKLGGTGEIARDLAYRLYTLCERKKWADEALAYNGLVIAWPELTRLAIRPPEAPKPVEKELFE